MDTARISSVQFVRFPLRMCTEMASLARAGKLAIESDHPELSGRGVVSEAMARALSEDLV